MSFPQSRAEDTRFSGGTELQDLFANVSDLRKAVHVKPNDNSDRLAQFKFPSKATNNFDIEAHADGLNGKFNENINPESWTSLRPPVVVTDKVTSASIPCAGRLNQRRLSNGTDGQSLFDELENPPNSPMSIAGSYMSGNSAASSRRPSVTQLLSPSAANTRSAVLGSSALSQSKASSAIVRPKDEGAQFNNISTMVVERLHDLMQGDENVFKGRRGSSSSLRSNS